MTAIEYLWRRCREILRRPSRELFVTVVVELDGEQLAESTRRAIIRAQRRGVFYPNGDPTVPSQFPRPTMQEIGRSAS